MAERSAQAAQGAAAPGRAPQRRDERAQRTIFASGGVLGALAMSSCCIAPLVLFSLGVTGAWIGTLASLSPYKPYVFVATAVFLGLGFYRVYRRPGAAACDAEGPCATPLSMRITKSALWLSTGLVLAALAFPYYVPLLLET